MFNHIRHTPYAGGDGKGGVSIFAGGFQNQFGLETQIVAGVCKILPCFTLLSSLHLTLGFLRGSCVLTRLRNHRLHPGLRDNHPRGESTEDCGSENAECSCVCLGGGGVLGLLVFAEYFPV